MALKIKVIAGPLKGQEFRVKPGLRFGRTKGEILLDDPKVSSLHAFLTEEGDEIILNDNGSKNGIRVKGDRVEMLSLRHGVVFQIGRSEFEVVSDEPATRVAVAAPSPAPVIPIRPMAPARPTEPMTVEPPPAQQTKESEAETPPPRTVVDPLARKDKSPPAKETQATKPTSATKAEPTEGRKWNDILADLAMTAIGKVKDQPKAVVALNPAVRLNFVGGIQAETRWTLGYGPRRAGSASVDLPIFEQGAPELCFEIIPAPEGVTFRTNHPKQVTLNGKEVRVGSLKEGDLIMVGQTRIEVELIK